MTTIRQLIEHLDVTEDYLQFALDAEPFGDDLVQTWTGIENGAHLLWLAAAVGVEPKQIIATACDLLTEVFEQIETAEQEAAQVLKAVHEWQRGERSADEVDRSGWEAYGLIARMGVGHPFRPMRMRSPTPLSVSHILSEISLHRCHMISLCEIMCSGVGLPG
jgi:hypothetical protein